MAGLNWTAPGSRGRPPIMTPAITAAKPRGALAMDFLKNRAGFWINAWITGWICTQPAWIRFAAAAAAALGTGYDKERIFYARRKMDQIRATSAKMLVVPCHSCHGQFNNIKKEYEMADLEVKYLWELVADCMIL